MKKLALLAFLCGFSYAAQAQQDAMFTKYMFNPLAYNPAYAGSVDALDVTLLHRHQWFGIKGAPMTQNLTVHSPIKNKNIGLGGNMSLDRVGPSRAFNFYMSFAYRIKFGDHSKGKGGYISLGMQGGFTNYTADWRQLNTEDPNDPAFQNQQPNLWLPNFGAGVYVHTKNWFVGFSAPSLITSALRKRTANEPTAMPVAHQFRHYFLTGGIAVKLSPNVVFRPSVMFKNVGLFIEKYKGLNVGAPNEFDLDVAFLFNKIFWVGAAFRSAFEFKASSYDSVDFWASLRLKNGLRIGASFDYTLTKLRGPAQGSYEIMLGYDLYRPNIGQIEHVRYF